MSREQPKTMGEKVTTFATFVIENRNLISVNENRPFTKQVAI